MRSIITNHIHKVGYWQAPKITIIYREEKSFWFYDVYENCIVRAGCMENGEVVNTGAIPLKYHTDISVYKKCFLIRNDRGGLIYC